jgi:hypothetical protein
MMQRPRRLVACAAAIGLLTLGGITAGVEAAHANVAGFCHGTGATATCTLNETIAAPASVTVGVSATPTNGPATVSWTATCTEASTTDTVSSGTTSTTPTQIPLTPLPATAGGQCTVKAVVSLPTTDATNALTAAMTYTPAASASPSASASSSPAPAAYHPFKGYAGRCMDDAGNSFADRTKIQIWKCNPSDQAQYWMYSGGELIHGGMCVNDQRSGGNGSKVILYTCNGAANEIWVHLANGELKLKANGGKYCLDDPAYSTRNGTQLIVYTCKDSANQRWYQP